MKRRSFIKTAAATAAATPIVLGGIPVRAQSPLAMLAQMPAENDRILIIAQLFGGNDGLNTLIPALDDEYYRIRPTIAVPKEDAWNEVGDIFLHPSLALGSKGGIARMLEVGSVAIVQGVGYDNPNLSHFRSTDIWLSGINDSDPNTRLDTGWIGRYLEKRYPGFPLDLPEHPLAIQFGGFSLTLISSKGRMGIEVTDPSGQKGVGAQLDTLDPDSAGTAYAYEYAFIADIAGRSNKYAQAVKSAYAAGLSQLRGEYGNDGFAQQMKSVGALIAGGMKTKVYVVSMGGFDTHVTQQYEGNTGTHPSLLHRFSDAVAQLHDDLVRLGQADRVVGITVSEFGRRPYENGSLGTDHGAASVQFVWGTQVNSGVFGNAYDLKTLNANGDLYHQIDYREIYAEILLDWFGLPFDEMRQVLRKDDLMPIDVLQAQPSSVAGRDAIRSGLSIAGNYPNPFSSSTTLDIRLDSPGHAILDITTMRGEHVGRLVDRRLDAGTHRISYSADLPAGTYLCTLRMNGRAATHVMRCVR